MKKVLGVFVTVLSLVLVTGCGNSSSSKTITCTKQENGQEVTMITSVDGNDKVTKFTTESKITASSKEELNLAVTMLEMTSTMFEDVKGVSIKVKKSGLTATLSMEVDLNKISEEDLEELDMDNIKATGAEFKKAMEDEGATCK